MLRLSRNLIDLACQSGLISQSDKEIYQFGFEVTLLKCAHIITMLLIGLAFHMLVEAALFLVAYSSLRIYAGGYHSKSRLRCYIISCFMMCAVLLIAKQQQFNPTLFLCAAFVSMCIIFLLSPVENRNNPLDDTERKHYKKRTYIIGFVQLFFLVLFFFLGLYTYLIILSLSIFALSLMIIIGYSQVRIEG